MSRIIHYIKLFFLSIFYKCKIWWENIWSSKKSPAVSEKETEETFISSENYNSRFSNSGLSSEVDIVKEIWDQIDSSIPKETMFPNPSTVSFFRPMRSDFYNLLFPYSPNTPDLFVDHSIWTEILSHLPEGYEIPPTVTTKLMKPMSSESYDNIFSSAPSNSKVFVDNRVWEEIMKGLPSNYKIPYSYEDIETKRQKVASPFIMKHKINEYS